MGCDGEGNYLRWLNCKRENLLCGTEKKIYKTNLQDVKPANNPEIFCLTAIDFDISVYIHLYNEVKSSALSYSITNYDITVQGGDTSSLYVCWTKPSFISVMYLLYVYMLVFKPFPVFLSISLTHTDRQRMREEIQ